jgi:outer membrane protein assembly factor BamA
MQWFRILFFLLVVFSGLVLPLAAQDQEEVEYQDAPILQQSNVTIRNIYISGNKKTKPYIIKREFIVKEGGRYSISNVLKGLRVTRQNLMNTALFVEAAVFFSNWFNDSMDIQVEVKERWYYFPLPYLKPADRNWNVWLNDYNLGLDRVNYGMKFLGNNITGRNDKLNIWLINGYTQRLAFKYYNPFSDNSLRHGWGIDVSYARNREVNLNTLGNKQQFFNDPSQFNRKQVYAGGMYSYRKGSIERHYVRLGVHNESIGDTILFQNNDYYGKGLKQVFYPELRYTYQYFNLDYIPYPIKGTSVEFDFTRKGINGTVDLTQFKLRVGKYLSLPKKMYTSIEGEFQLSVPFDQPFFTQGMLGYSDSYLRGLENYVVDGVAGGFIRNTIGKEILFMRVKTGLKSKTYGQIPFRVYLKGYGDIGYVYNSKNLAGNMLNNKFLYTGGFGLDIISIYDIVLRIEYSFNQLNQRGLFVHKADSRN